MYIARHGHGLPPEEKRILIAIRSAEAIKEWEHTKDERARNRQAIRTWGYTLYPDDHWTAQVLLDSGDLE